MEGGRVGGVGKGWESRGGKGGGEEGWRLKDAIELRRKSQKRINITRRLDSIVKAFSLLGRKMMYDIMRKN